MSDHRLRPDNEGSDAEEKEATTGVGEGGKSNHPASSSASKRTSVVASASIAADESSKEAEEEVMENGTVVTQIDYVNYFIPFLAEITACPYYWGKIDR